MNKSFVLSTCLVFCFYANMDACDCLPIPTFCESIVDADNGQLWEQLSVHHIKVLSAQPNSLTIKVKKSFAGENLEGLQRTILDGNGANCILFASINLAVGEEYIIASTGGSDTILLSECGLSFLKVVNGEVIGAIAPGVTSVPLASFANTANCGDLGGITSTGDGVIGGLFVRPTLVKNMVEIGTVSLHQNADLKLSIYDVTGRLVHTQRNANFGLHASILVDSEAWAAGIYFLKLEAAGETFTQKLFKIDAD